MSASTAATAASVGARTSSWGSRLDETILPVLLALFAALVIGDLLILSFGQSPAVVYRMMLEGSWGNAWSFGQVLFKTTTLIFTGLAVSIGLRAGVFNIGAESQLAAGGFLAAATGLWLPSGTPNLIGAALCILAALLGGGAAGAVPGWLKARFGAHEVIVTIMMNFVVLALLNYVVASHLHVPETLRTPSVHTGEIARLSQLWPAFHGSAANFVLIIALLLSVLLWFLLFRMRAGFDLRAVGLQPAAAEYGGIRVGRVWFSALALSGAIAGLGGINYVLGYKGYYEEGFAGGAGFLGIAVALLGRNHPFGVILAALLLATLSQGGLAINALVPKDIVDVLQAAVIIAIAVSVPEVRRLLRLSSRSSA
jgi:general nucleoside transport system permease protein